MESIFNRRLDDEAAIGLTAGFLLINCNELGLSSSSTELLLLMLLDEHAALDA